MTLSLTVLVDGKIPHEIFLIFYFILFNYEKLGWVLMDGRMQE
jgi:hypothetical protein